MRYDIVQTLKDEDFKRSTGVHRPTFEKMLLVVETGLRDFGRPPKLSRADQLLMTMMYWREYRTEFHLPGRKALQSSETVFEVVLIDATEQPIERPKKDNAGIIAAKRSGIPKKHS